MRAGIKGGAGDLREELRMGDGGEHRSGAEGGMAGGANVGTRRVGGVRGEGGMKGRAGWV